MSEHLRFWHEIIYNTYIRSLNPFWLNPVGLPKVVIKILYCIRILLRNYLMPKSLVFSYVRMPKSYSLFP